MKRFITVCILICCLFSFLTFANAEGMPSTQMEQTGNVTGNVDINETIERYMNARNELLTTGSTTALSEVAVPGVVNDEIAHRAYIFNANIEIRSTLNAVVSVDTWDDFTVVEVTEVQRVATNDIALHEVSHIVTLIATDDDMIVISDNYYESTTGFESCSYVDPDVEIALEPNALNNNSSGCFLHIANQEVGYLEKADGTNLYSHTANAGNANYTKYGAWYGCNPMPWCAVFVSWCADQANISTNVIPKVSYVPTLASFFKNQGTYHNSIAAGGSYTPIPGDIVIFAGNDHTGIVYSVSNGYMTVIDGNQGGKVDKRPLAITDSGVIGFGSPNYGSTSHSWVYQAPLYRCTNCGVTATSIPSISSV